MLKYTALAALMAATPALAQQQCGPVEVVRNVLATQYNERQYSIGVAPSAILETWVNDMTGTWTMIATNADGFSCLVASGNGFEVVTRGGL